MEAKIKEIVSRYDAKEGFLVPILQDVQKELNYLPQDALTEVGKQLQVPISRVFEVATFYKAFSLTPRGKHHMCLCMGTACHVRGASLIENHIERTLDIKSGETTPDLEFTFETVNCLGACALGPILTVNDKYHGQMSIGKTNKIFKELGKKVKDDED
jgi:NADH-quinone oxidoreductase subunit E